MCLNQIGQQINERIQSILKLFLTYTYSLPVMSTLTSQKPE